MSFGGLSLIPNAVDQQRPQILYGTVSKTQPAPTGFNDPLYVVEPWNPNHYHVVSRFPAIHGASLPQHGADVVLIKDNTGALRCVWWDGTYTAP